MTRDEFMKQAKETSYRILESKSNGIMNLVEQAWAEGKRNAELDAISEIVKQAIERAQVSYPATPEWISVEDRLPEKEGKYLCWFGKNILAKGASIATYFEEWKAFGSLESLETYPNVTHWMPLPPPPGGES